MTREPDRYEEKARELFRSLVMDVARSVPMIAAALRREREDALNEAADCVQWADEKAKIRALAHPAAAPASPPAKEPAQRRVTCVECQGRGHIYGDKCRNCGGYGYEMVPADTKPAAAPAACTCRYLSGTRFENPGNCPVHPSEPVAPAPDWSVRAGDKCTRVACDKKVVAACLPHQFGGCEEHMREHDARCSFASKALADGGET